ncbi:MAG: hypothetical protein IJ711_03705, partial [Lachnospiraceae bacterium]|nr:hypothetical protein [Lachnospiraceae bacterium]
MSRYRISEHKDEIITHIIKNLIWLFVASIVSVLCTICTMLYKLIISGNVDYYIIILTAISVLFSLCTFIFSYICKRGKANTEEALPIPNFRIKKVECELLFEDRKNLVSSVTYEMIANKDDIEYFEKELMWTGKGYSGTVLKETNGDYQFEIDDSNDAMHKYRIKFRNQIKCQDVIKFTLET